MSYAIRWELLWARTSFPHWHCFPWHLDIKKHQEKAVCILNQISQKWLQAARELMFIPLSFNKYLLSPASVLDTLLDVRVQQWGKLAWVPAVGNPQEMALGSLRCLSSGTHRQWPELPSWKARAPSPAPAMPHNQAPGSLLELCTWASAFRICV